MEAPCGTHREGAAHTHGCCLSPGADSDLGLELGALSWRLAEPADPSSSFHPRGSGVLLEGELVDVSRHSISDAHGRKVRMLGVPAGTDTGAPRSSPTKAPPRVLGPALSSLRWEMDQVERDPLRRARLWTDGRVWVLSEKTDQALNPSGMFGVEIGKVKRRKG